MEIGINRILGNARMRGLKGALIIMTGLFIIVNPLGLMRSCGPFLSMPVLTFMSHPDLPLANYAAGKLSVLQPSYARSYLVVAYRYLSGGEFNPAEQQALDSVWTYRINRGSYNWDPNAGASEEDKWHTLRFQYSDPSDTARISKADRESSYNFDYYDYYGYKQSLNDATWRTASATLLKLVEKFGRSSSEVKNWLEGESILLDPYDSNRIRLASLSYQDSAAADTHDSNNPAGAPPIAFDRTRHVERIPPLAAASASAAVRWDRAYQNAVGYFYMNHYDAAIERFSHIASESGSPWQATAAYMIVRCHIRKALVKEESPDLAEMEAARKQIDALVEDSRYASMRDAAEHLRSFVINRLEPEKRLDELAARLEEQHRPEGLFDDMIDYTVILDRAHPPIGFDTPHVSRPESPTTAGLTDWITTFENSDTASKQHAFQRWHSTKSTQWLCASITKAQPEDPETPSLIEAAMKLAESSPAYVHCIYHALWLMIDMGKMVEARTMIDAILARPERLTVGGINLFRQLRLRIDGTLSDWVRDAQAAPAGITDESDWTEGLDMSSDSAKNITPHYAAVLNDQATRAINELLPLSTLLSVCSSSELPTDIRRDLALVGWTRSYALGESDLSIRFASMARDLCPGLKSNLDAYLAAATPPDRQHAAIDLIAHAPGLNLALEEGIRRTEEVTQLDDLRDNWWCPLPLSADSLKILFLSKDETNLARQEINMLRTMPAGPNFLITQLLDWAKSAPDDQRIPEDLHRAIVASHIGCADSTTTPLSKAAWKLLHTDYKNSPWTKKTPYYY